MSWLCSGSGKVIVPWGSVRTAPITGASQYKAAHRSTHAWGTGLHRLSHPAGVTPIVRIVTDLRVLIHMTAGMSDVDGTQIRDMVWKMALLTAQMSDQENGMSVPPRHPSA